MTHLSVRSVNAIFLKIRRRIAELCERQSSSCGNSQRVDISGDPCRAEPKNGRGVYGRSLGKTVLFGIVVNEKAIHTEIIVDRQKAAIRAVMRGETAPSSVVPSNGARSYDGLVDVGCARHFRVNRALTAFPYMTGSISSAESFWSYFKRRLAKFNGVPKRTFYLHLKETEFRFNNRGKQRYQRLLELLRENPL